ncbi:MAG: response regulator [Peptostreptococcaceae bacterium]|jgi:putative two-component system response regulator|nr:response regulator [Peptostreptococcaceae bacterium]
MNKKPLILIVDDFATNLDILVEILKDDYKLMACNNGYDALDAVNLYTPDLILLDIMMPKLNGYEVCKIIKRDYSKLDIPIIFVSAIEDDENEAKGLELGAVDYIKKPYNPLVVKKRIKTHLTLKFIKEELKNQNVILEQKVKERTKELELTQNVTIHTLANLAESRDPETGGHIIRTKYYVKLLAEELKKSNKYINITDEYVYNLFICAPLHDVGKIAVEDRILKKPDKLTKEEFEEMKKHTIYGKNAFINAEKTLGKNSFLKLAAEIAYTHHEKWDGSGYPQGLKGEDIPISGRLMALADVYDALISNRVYKPPFSHEKVVSIIKSDSNTHFDPFLVELFLSIQHEFYEIAKKYKD